MCLKCVYTRAVQLIACDSHAHLLSKAGSVIGNKSPSNMNAKLPSLSVCTVYICMYVYMYTCIYVIKLRMHLTHFYIALNFNFFN